MDERLRERVLLAAVGGAQGFAIWLLVEAWPEAHAARAAAVALFTFLAVSALVFHFAFTGAARGRLIALALGTGVLYAAVAARVGFALPDATSVGGGDEVRGFTWALASLVTLYVLGPFLQIHQRAARLHFPYRELFLHGWNNLFVTLVGALFVGALWLVLALWAALFDLVGIGLFKDVFFEEAFVYPVTGAAVGFGIALGRDSERVVATLRGITLSVFRGLLPLVSFVALLFLAALPFTGLDGLWATNHASQVLLTWVGLTVLFLNAVYQDGSAEAPLAGPVRRLVEAALLAMTLYVAISAYGLWLRIAQHGLTPERFWGVLFAVVLGSYAAGYAFAVLRRGRPWLRAVRAVNLAVALLVVALGLLTHTPLLDPIGWSAWSQYRRLAGGRVSAAEFDYGYLRFRLGREGRERLEILAALDRHPEIAAIRRGVEEARAAEGYWQWQQGHRSSVAAEHFEVHPPGTALPEGLLAAARREQGYWLRDCAEPGSCAAFPVELDGAPPAEWVVVSSQRGWSQLRAFAEDPERGFLGLGPLQAEGAMPGAEELARQLREWRIGTAPAPYRELLIGETRFHLVPQPAPRRSAAPDPTR